VRAANDTPYGLAAYYYTRDMGRIWRLAEALEYGIHGINTGFVSSEVVPFGGVKESASAARARSTASRNARDQVPRHGRRIGVIVEQRDYHVFTGKLNELVKLYDTEGIELQQSYLGNLIGVFTTDIGALSTYTSLWGYDNFAEREQRRAKLQADDAWKAFSREDPAVDPHTAQSDPRPTSFSPIR